MLPRLESFQDQLLDGILSLEGGILLRRLNFNIQKSSPPTAFILYKFRLRIKIYLYAML